MFELDKLAPSIEYSETMTTLQQVAQDNSSESRSRLNFRSVGRLFKA